MSKVNLLSTIVLLCGLLFFSIPGHTQKNTEVKSVDIVSSYRPQIANGAKFQFLPSTPVKDSSRLLLSYQPDLRVYSPGYPLSPLRPLALPLKMDPGLVDRFYVKLGYGNLKSPYAKLFFTKRNGASKGYSIAAFHQNATGKIASQKFGQTSLSTEGFQQFKSSNIEVKGGVQFSLAQVYRYGVRTSSMLPISNDDQFRYTNISVKSGFQTIEPTRFGIMYGGDIEAGIFSNQKGEQEKSVKLSVPLKKQLTDNWRISLLGNAQLTTIYHHSGHSITNNVVASRLLVSHTSNLFTVQGGLQPTWDLAGFSLLPILNGTVAIDSTKLLIQWGWEGVNQINSFQQLFTTNNWVESPAKMLNTRTTEFYVGVKGAPTSHITYQLRGGWARIKNLPLYLNDTSVLTKGNSFHVLFEPQVQRLQLVGEIAYQIADRVGIRANATINQFADLKMQAHTWGIIPVEFNLTGRVEVLKDLYIDLTAFSWQGAPYLQRDGKMGRSKGSFDLSTHVEFKLNSSWRWWGQFNNLFNQSYQRWNQYPVYGFNFLTGVVFSPQSKRSH